jgi:hypothetical protein
MAGDVAREALRARVRAMPWAVRLQLRALGAGVDVNYHFSAGTEAETETEPTPPRPVIVFFHGGGFTYFSGATRPYDALCRTICRETGAVVVSVSSKRRRIGRARNQLAASSLISTDIRTSHITIQDYIEIVRAKHARLPARCKRRASSWPAGPESTPIHFLTPLARDTTPPVSFFVQLPHRCRIAVCPCVQSGIIPQNQKKDRNGGN